MGTLRRKDIKEFISESRTISTVERKMTGLKVSIGKSL